MGGFLCTRDSLSMGGRVFLLSLFMTFLCLHTVSLSSVWATALELTGLSLADILFLSVQHTNTTGLSFSNDTKEVTFALGAYYITLASSEITLFREIGGCLLLNLTPNLGIAERQENLSGYASDQPMLGRYEK